MKKKWLFPILLTALLIGCSNNVEPTENFVVGVKNVNGETVQVLNTTVFLRTYSKKAFNKLFPTYTSIIQRVHKESDRYNQYNDYSEIYNLNKDKQLSNASDEVLTMLNNVIELSELTDGKFNPAIGPLIDIWSPLFNNGTNNDPSAADIEDALTKVPSSPLSDYIKIENKNVQYQNLDLELDLGAYAKGFALEVANEAFKDDENPLMIYAGGSSIILKGTKPYAEGNWIIDIDNPDNYLSSVAQLYLKGTHAISTSGDYQKYFLNSEGLRRHHILNPHTGYPATNYRSITIYSDRRADILDALTTALFNCETDQEFVGLIDKVEEHYELDIEFVYVKKDGNSNYLGVSSGAKEVIKNPKLEVREITC